MGSDDGKSPAQLAQDAFNELSVHNSICYYDESKLKVLDGVSKSLLSVPVAAKVFILMVIKAVAEVRDLMIRQDEDYISFYHIRSRDEYPFDAVYVTHKLLKKTIQFTDEEMTYIVGELAGFPYLRIISHPYLPDIVVFLEKRADSNPLSPGLREAVCRLAETLGLTVDAAERKLTARLSRLLQGCTSTNLTEGEAWADAAMGDIDVMPQPDRDLWVSILEICEKTAGANPSQRWLTNASRAVKAIDEQVFANKLMKWFPLVDKPRTQPVPLLEYCPDRNHMIGESNGNILKGLAWCCSFREDAELARTLTGLALSSYRKVPKIGPRLVRVGNACVWALGNMPGMEGITQLAILRVRVKFGTAQKVIEKALNTAAERVGIPRDELEEMAVPVYGMAEVGVRREQLGDCMVELAVAQDFSVELKWFKADGRQVKSVPASVKKEHGDDLKELKTAIKDIDRMLGAQRERLDQLNLQQRTWAYPVWQERYLDHPLIGALTRRLIWRFTNDGQRQEGIFHNDRLVDVRDRPVQRLDAGTRVELWHPIVSTRDEIVAWREWFETHQVRQPFKQAHREVYVLTDAERATATYSNRYAAHILKQHQFNALCAARGWKNSLRLLVDQEFPPATRLLPQWGLRAEFWIEGIGEEYGQDTNETGTFYHISTDQVRFHRIEAGRTTAHAGGGLYDTRAAGEPIPLEQIPALVLSEIMRDVDLFVGVASVGNDPTWQDGGPEGRYRDYWNSYSFGELTQRADTRKQVLERLVPRLKIADRCSFSDRFLLVRGDLRTYKIHLGSGNILMSPDDRYLCIVARQSQDAAGKVFLPFDGDALLSIILSKAMLLADDTKIKDSTILSQIAG